MCCFPVTVILLRKLQQQAVICQEDPQDPEYLTSLCTSLYICHIYLEHTNF